jgi:nucleoside-diphosphate-sugar epimerase
MTPTTRVLVTGAGGFIGHDLVGYLVERGYWVRGVDLKLPEFEPTRAHEFELLDLRHADACLRAVQGIDEVYALAADMGGIGYIESHKATIAHNNVLINAHTLEAARRPSAGRSRWPPPPTRSRCGETGSRRARAATSWTASSWTGSPRSRASASGSGMT